MDVTYTLENRPIIEIKGPSSDRVVHLPTAYDVMLSPADKVVGKYIEVIGEIYSDGLPAEFQFGFASTNPNVSFSRTVQAPSLEGLEQWIGRAVYDMEELKIETNYCVAASYPALEEGNLEGTAPGFFVGHHKYFKPRTPELVDSHLHVKGVDAAAVRAAYDLLVKNFTLEKPKE